MTMLAKNLPKNERVELIPAFVWDCPSCGREQFERSIVPEFSPEEMADLRLQLGVDPLEDGEFLTQPKSVTCKHCNNNFETDVFGVERHEEDADA